MYSYQISEELDEVLEFVGQNAYPDDDSCSLKNELEPHQEIKLEMEKQESFQSVSTNTSSPGSDSPKNSPAVSLYKELEPRKRNAPKRLDMVSFDEKILAESSGTTAKCPHCGKIFKNKEALGGHTSKAHPNKSSAYAKKMRKREEQAPFRMIHKESKVIFKHKYPDLDLSMNRTKLLPIKKKIKNLIGDIDYFSVQFE